MPIHTAELSFPTRGEVDLVDITDRIKQVVADSGIRDGLVTTFVPGATGAITAIEFEHGLLEDFPDILEELIPKKRHYKHHDDNGHAHIRAALIGPSETIPIVGGALTLGVWQQIIFVELDTKPRDRRIVVQVFGE